MPEATNTEDVGAPPICDNLVAKVFTNPWRSRILSELTMRPMSVKQFAEEVGGESSTISRHFRRLAEWGLIVVVEEKRGGRRRGGVERLYRTVQRDHLDAEGWAALSQAEREARSANAIAAYFQRVIDAVEAKTFDADLLRHWTWEALDLDRIARDELGERLDEVLAWVAELAVQSALRMRESGEESIPTTVGLGAFRSPLRARTDAARPHPTKNRA